jgi:serine/threonine-protein kinase/endoribonuclease IRE1
LQQLARSLEDWEVEDFVLLATVDGDLYASDRKTGQERWHFKAGHPLVETRHFRTNRSVLDEDYEPIDHYIWVVEPTRDGELYLWRPSESGPSLAKMAWTMKKVVEEIAPFNDEDNRVLYMGDKKTTMVTLNAATGTVIKEFGSTGSYVNKVESESCLQPNALADGDSEECNDGTITLGRTEYTVGIHRADGSPIASLKYSEWGPNTQDHDLIQQNLITKDGRYVASQHDGRIYGFDFERPSEGRPIFTKTLSSPVARVFDVLRRWDGAPDKEPELIALPQPPFPAGDEDSLRLRSDKVFINQTEEGSWYALSGSRYPLILSAPVAPIHTLGWWQIKDAWELLNDPEKSSALVGTHQLPDGLVDRVAQTPLLLDPPREHDNVSPTDAGITGSLSSLSPETSGIFDTAWRVPELAIVKVVDLVSNPAAIVLFFLALMMYKDRILSVVWKSWSKAASLNPQSEIKPTVPSPAAYPEDRPDTQVENPAEDAAAIDQPAEPNLPTPPATPEEAPAIAQPDAPEAAAGLAAEGLDAAAGVEGAKKKKSHRGRRGGVKHKKGNKDKREGSQSRDEGSPHETVDEVVNKAKTLGREPKLEPDIITVPGNVDEVSGQILKMGSLEVNEAEQLGTGSNGTIVFAGKWDGRDVAVKRMLVQFNEIASQETRLLRESDDHPNGKQSEVSITRPG